MAGKRGSAEKNSLPVSAGLFPAFPSPMRIAIRMEPPRPTRVPKEESKVTMGPQIPAPARARLPSPGNISNVDAVYDAVEYVDKLGSHSGESQPENQFPDAVLPEIIFHFHR